MVQRRSPRRPTRADDVYTAIRSDIVSLKLKPGSMVQEDALAQQLGVSRTPVREALRRLGQEGLVRTLPKKGTLVAGVSINDVREVFQMRLALEPLAARLATSNIPAEIVEQLRSRHLPQEGSGMAASEDYQDLHLVIRHYCDNRRLESMLELLILDTRRILNLSGIDYVQHSLGYHLEILDALARRDGLAAEEAMREHLQCSLKSLISDIVGWSPELASLLEGDVATNLPASSQAVGD